MIEILVSPDAEHQHAAAEAIRQGCERFGEQVQIRSFPHSVSSNTVVCWGWRKGKAIKAARPGANVLVIERGYVGDRHVWHSLAWNGLNGHGRFAAPDDGGARWNRLFPDALKPVRDGGDYLLLLGQVPKDMSLEGMGNHASWYQRTHETLEAHFCTPVYFRPHPQALAIYGASANLGLPVIDGPLSDALAGARAAFAYNSNSLVDAALAGVPVYAFNPGAMVWPISGQDGVPKLDTQERAAWAARLAWCQWTLEEIASGDAWAHLAQAWTATDPWCTAFRGAGQ